MVPLPLHRGGIKLCTNSPITEVSFAFLQAPSVQRLKNLYIVPDNRSFFCLLFFSKKSTVKEKYGQRKVGGIKEPDGGFPSGLYVPRGMREQGIGRWRQSDCGIAAALSYTIILPHSRIKVNYPIWRKSLRFGDFCPFSVDSVTVYFNTGEELLRIGEELFQNLCSYKHSCRRFLGGFAYDGA